MFGKEKNTVQRLKNVLPTCAENKYEKSLKKWLVVKPKNANGYLEQHAHTEQKKTQDKIVTVSHIDFFFSFSFSFLVFVFFVFCKNKSNKKRKIRK